MALLLVDFHEGHERNLPRAPLEWHLFVEQGCPERSNLLPAFGRQEVDFAPPCLADNVAHPLFDETLCLEWSDILHDMADAYALCDLAIARAGASTLGELAALGMPGARAKAASALAQVMADDPGIFSRGASLEDAVAKLRALPGIGEWTAQYIAMRELREPDAFPAADIGLLRAMADDDGKRPSPPELLSRSERWRPWRAYAALHLWAADATAPILSGKADEREAA